MTIIPYLEYTEIPVAKAAHSDKASRYGRKKLIYFMVFTGISHRSNY